MATGLIEVKCRCFNEATALVDQQLLSSGLGGVLIFPCLMFNPYFSIFLQHFSPVH